MNRMLKCHPIQMKVCRPYLAAHQLLQKRIIKHLKVKIVVPKLYHLFFMKISCSLCSSAVTVVLCPVGGAPIMRQRKWEVDSTQTVGFIASFIRKKLTLQKSDSLVCIKLQHLHFEMLSLTIVLRQFFYVNQSFAPSLDQSVQNLFDCFGSDGKLILAYCRTQAWG